MAMEKVEKVMERGEIEGAREKMIEAAMVMTERMAPAYRVADMSEGVAIKGDVEDPLAGRGGWQRITDMANAR